MNMCVYTQNQDGIYHAVILCLFDEGCDVPVPSDSVCLTCDMISIIEWGEQRIHLSHL